MLTLVVARYNEDVSWVNLIRGANVVIVNKSAIGNTGREASSYLWFIAQHYHSLAGDYLFCQGDPFPHCPDFIERVRAWLAGGAQRSARPTFGPRLQCDWEGNPHHPGLRLGVIYEDIFGAGSAAGDLPPEIHFTAGAQFLRTDSELRAMSEAEYWRILKIANARPDAPWVLERLWDYLIPMQKEEGEMKQ